VEICELTRERYSYRVLDKMDNKDVCLLSHMYCSPKFSSINKNENIRNTSGKDR